MGHPVIRAERAGPREVWLGPWQISFDRRWFVRAYQDPRAGRMALCVPVSPPRTVPLVADGRGT